METTLEIIVRSTAIDFLGHVNNARYIEYLEWGRADWYDQAGCSFDEMRKKGIGTVVANINIDYLASCYRGDLLILKTRPVEVGNSSYVMQQEVIKKEMSIKASEARVTTVFIDLKTGKSRPIPHDLLKFLGINQR
ncbi:MAG: thioesterase family protein [Bacillota bacterium]|nr:thioesterase family protein [Bacillota bacterium]